MLATYIILVTVTSAINEICCHRPYSPDARNNGLEEDIPDPYVNQHVESIPRKRDVLDNRPIVSSNEYVDVQPEDDLLDDTIEIQDKRLMLRGDLGKRFEEMNKTDYQDYHVQIKKGMLRNDLGKRLKLRSDLGKRILYLNGAKKPPRLRADLGKRGMLRNDLG